MKLFWAIIVTFTLAAALVAWGQLRVEQHAAPPPTRMAAQEPMTAPAAPAAPGGEPPPQPAVTEFPAADALRDLVRDEHPAVAEQPAEQPSGEAGWGGGSTPGARGAGPAGTGVWLDERARADTIAADLLASAEQREADADAGPGSPAQGPAPDAAPADHEHQDLTSGENPWEDGGVSEDAPRLTHSVEQQPDGSILLDGMFTIRGEGTADAPYEITWDLLMSAAETFQPRLGMKDIPERIGILDGKHVKISGHLMFPMAGFEADEVLAMLNMWDGCCIGTMPSPYDAIEVQLAKPVEAAPRQFMNFGTLRGRLNVDPYLINDWLIGLYVMEDATLEMGM